jgi:enoyl-CoA hydratase/carnithine racemase
MATELVQSSIDSGSGVLTLTLNRPQQRNSLTLALISALAAAFAEAAADDAVRAIVLAGNGPGFCAGHDLKELTEHRSDDDNGQAFYRDTMQQCSAMMLCIVRCPKPVIARVHGIATAAGCQLVASCDLAVASSHARFATPGVNIGLFCSTPMVALSRNVSRKHAMEMLLLGDMISAEKAAELGLVNQAVPDEELDSTIAEYAATIAAKPAVTVAIGKEAYYRQLDMNIDDAYDYVSEVMVQNMLVPDAKEGIDAFIEKRKPNWQK